jgi:hypothetical protein
VQRIWAIALSVGSEVFLKDRNLGPFIEKVQIIDRLDPILGTAKVYLPARYLSHFTEINGIVVVEASTQRCSLVFGHAAFYLTTAFTVFKFTANPVTVIRFAAITAATEHSTVVIVTFSGETVSKDTAHAKPMIAAWESHRHCDPIAIESGVCSARTHALALALFNLSRPSSFASAPAMRLFEAAIRGGSATPLRTSMIGVSRFDVSALLRDVVTSDRVDDICLAISGYLSPEEIPALQHLILLLVMCVTTTKRLDVVAPIGKLLFALSTHGETLSLLIRFFWVSVKGGMALECLVPALIASGLSEGIVRQSLRAIVTTNPAVLGSSIVNHWIDGVVRRRSFGLPSVARVFSVVATLPFKTPRFVTIDCVRLLLSAVVVGVHQPQRSSTTRGCLSILRCSRSSRWRPASSRAKGKS